MVTIKRNTVMKKLSFVFLALAAMFAACQQEVVLSENGSENGTDVDETVMPDVIYATVNDDNSTKAGMERYDAGGSVYKYRHHWDSNDMIYVYKGTKRTQYTCSDPTNGVFSKGTVTDIAGGKSFDKYCAAFSTTGEIEVRANNTLSVFNANSYIPAYGNFMVASSEDGTHYTFTSLVGWVKLSLKAPNKTVSEIRIAKYSMGEDYEGFMYYNFSSDTYSYEGSQGECLGYSFSPGIALNENTATDIYLALPPMSYSGMPFEIKFSDNTYAYLSTNNTVNITANAVTPMAETEVGFKYTTLTGGGIFNAALKNLAAGTDNLTYTSNDELIKGITLSLGEESPTPTGVNVASGPSYIPVYASFDAGTGIVTLHTSAHKVSLDVDSRNMFQNMKELESIDMLSQIVRSKVGETANNTTGIRMMFQNCAKLTSVDLSRLDTHEAKDFSSVFFGCSSLSSVDLSTLDISSATTLCRMFSGCSSIDTIDVSTFNTALVTDFSCMFQNCTSLDSINFGTGFFKNAGIKTLSCMFYGCSSLKNIKLTASNTGSMYEYSPYDATFEYICYNCSSLKSFVNRIPGIVTDYTNAFANCANLEVVDFGTLYEFTSCKYPGMYDGCYKLRHLDMNRFQFGYLGDTETSNNRYMFRNACRDADSLDFYIRTSSSINRLVNHFSTYMSAEGFTTFHY